MKNQTKQNRSYPQAPTSKYNETCLPQLITTPKKSKKVHQAEGVTIFIKYFFYFFINT